MTRAGGINKAASLGISHGGRKSNVISAKTARKIERATRKEDIAASRAERAARKAAIAAAHAEKAARAKARKAERAALAATQGKDL